MNFHLYCSTAHCIYVNVYCGGGDTNVKLCISKVPLFFAMMLHEGEELWLHSFLNSALYGGEWVDSGRDRFAPKGSDHRLI